MAGYDPDVFGGATSGGGFDADVFPAPQPQTVVQGKQEAQPVQDFSGNLQFATPWGTLDSRIPLPQGINRRLAQYGSGVADFGLAIRQRLAGESEDKTLRDEALDKRRTDARLNDDFAGKALNFAGASAPVMAVPAGYLGIAGRAAQLLEGAIAGGLGGAAQPVAGDESVATNIAAGATLGGAIPGVIQGVRSLGRANPQTANLARSAIEQHGIPLGLSDVSGSTLTKATRSVLNDLPLTGSIGAAQDAAKQAGFNRAVGNTFGAPEPKLTPQVMDATKGRIGAELDRLWNSNTVAVDPQLLNRLQTLRAEASKLPRGEGARLTGWIDDLQSQIVPGANLQATIPGDVANRFQSKLGKESATATGFLKESLSGLRSELIGAFNRSVGGTDAAALTKARTQYKNFKTVEPLLDRGVTGTAGRAEGDVPASMLSEAVRRAYPSLSSNTAPPPIAELAQIGGRFLADRVPRTGGSPRAIVQNAAIGTGLTGTGLANPWVPAVGIPSALLLQGLLGSSTAAKVALKQPKLRGLLGSPELFPALTETGGLALQRGVSGLPLGLLGWNTTPLE